MYILFCFQTGFREQDFSLLTVLAMTLGELNYVDVFVESNNFPFTIDSYIVCGVFMLMMPIALVNLLVSTVIPVHYENMPIQIYRKFHLQKLKIFR